MHNTDILRQESWLTFDQAPAVLPEADVTGDTQSRFIMRHSCHTKTTRHKKCVSVRNITIDNLTTRKIHRKLKTYKKLYLCFHYVLDTRLTVFQVHLVLRTWRELWTEGIVEGKSVCEITQPSAVRLRYPITHHNILEKKDLK